MGIDFERNETDFIRQTVRDMVQNPRVGQVVQVYEHLVDNDDTNFEADVNFPEEDDLEHRVAPITNPGSDSIDVPRVGDKVVVQYVHGDKKNAVITDTVDTNEDRAVKGLAGMYRRRYPADTQARSPTLNGNIYLTGTTYYDKTAGLNDYRDLTPEQAFIRIAKKVDDMDEPEDDLPMLIELYDDPANDGGRIAMEANIIDKDPALSLATEMNTKDGTMESVAENETSGITTTISQDVKNDVMNLIADDGTNQYTVDFDPSVPSITIQNTADETGFKLDFNTGSFKILGAQGHGIESDGSGNFTWHHQSIDFSEGTTTTL